MLRGLYTATAGMLSQQKRVEMLSNNIANANTTGYKSDQSAVRAFPEMLLNRLEDSQTPIKNGAAFGTSTTIGSLNTGAYLQELIPQFTQGDIKETGLLSDVALVEEVVPVNGETNLKGLLLFPVQMEDSAIRYTRDGHFTVDSSGVLTSNGRPVLSTEGRQIQIQGNDYQISPEGIITENGQRVAQIDVRFEGDIRNLVKEGNGLYRTADNNALPSAIGNGQIQYSVKQQFLERSNVDVARNYTDMMTAYRAFEANQKVLQAYDRSMEKAANEIGRLR
ncbi:flagellar hook-basal body protein [Metabacillus fastidiosus]|uniref:flagellar hook-basal body protein n=1 Tax=Metabacillus fastidiosus TaxID=1458 RepID=UPI003D29285E